MKIIHVIPSLLKGGAERLTIDICNQLALLGNEVMLITFNNQNEFPEEKFFFKKAVCNSYFIPSVSGSPKKNIEALNDTIKAFNPDVIHTHLFLSEMVTHQLDMINVKWITHCHDNMFQLRKPAFKDLLSKKRVTEIYERRLLFKRYLTHRPKFIAISKDTFHYFKENLPGKLKQDVVLLNNAIQFDRFYYGNSRNVSEFFKLVTTGSFVPKKNQLFLIDVAEILKKKYPGFKLTMLGNGPLYQEIKNKVSLKKLDKNIFLPGNVDDVPAYLKEANVYVHPATYEPLGLAILEGMAAGLPAVCLDGKGNRDIIENGKNGFMLDEQNAELFAAKIIELVENKKLYQSISKYAIEYARNFDMKNYVERLLKIYNC